MDKETNQEIFDYLKNPKLTHDQLHDVAWAVGRNYDPYLICDLCETDDRFDDRSLMYVLQEGIEFFNNYMQIYEFARVMSDCGRKSVDYASLLKKILDSQNPKLIYYCRKNISAFPHYIMDKAMEVYGNCPKYLDKYISLVREDKDMKEEDKNRLISSLEKNKAEALQKPRYMPKCVKDYLDKKQVSDPSQYTQSILRSKTPYVLVEYAEHFGDLLGDDLKRVEDAIYDTESLLNICEMGAVVQGVDITRVEDAAIESQSAKYMYYVATRVDGSDPLKMLDHIRQTGDSKYIKLMEDFLSEPRK